MIDIAESKSQYNVKTTLKEDLSLNRIVCTHLSQHYVTCYLQLTL
jgi:hypothetical protein